MAILTNPKPAIYRNWYENTALDTVLNDPLLNPAAFTEGRFEVFPDLSERRPRRGIKSPHGQGGGGLWWNMIVPWTVQWQSLQWDAVFSDKGWMVKFTRSSEKASFQRGSNFISLRYVNRERGRRSSQLTKQYFGQTHNLSWTSAALTC